MSFAQNVKKELIAIEIDQYSICELAALIKINGSYNFTNQGLKINVITENASIARRIFTLVKHFTNQTCQITIVRNRNFSKNQYLLSIEKDVDKVLEQLDISFVDERTLKEHKLINNDEYKKAYLRGAFLASGSINNPQTASYHFEIKDNDYYHAKLLCDILDSFDLNAKIIERNNIYVIYIKEAEKIVDVLAYMSATQALFFYENIRVTRDVRNQTNRLANCEQANYEKSYNAALKQLENIALIDEYVGLEILSDKYQQLCRYRRLFPEYSLVELADVMSEELGEQFTKSKLNHWFRTINKKAEVIRNNLDKKEVE